MQKQGEVVAQDGEESAFFFFLPCRIPRLTSLALEMGRTQSWLQQQMEGL